MRYVSLDLVKESLPLGLEEEAQEALEELEKAESKEARAAALGDLTKSKAIWRKAKGALSRVSSGRCWYCEVRDIRADQPVDHFRPKGRVFEERPPRSKRHQNGGSAEKESHEGYWWLAFDWKNFRLSCTFCNSRRVDVVGGTEGGKQDHFPLCKGSPRAFCPLDDLKMERPMLLDPCDHKDPPLVTFNQDGQPVPLRSENDDAIANERASQSIRLYHLRHQSLVESRRRVWAKVDGLVDRGSRYLSEGTGREATDDVKTDLHELIQKHQPLSRVAHLALRGRRDVTWVRDWLEELETTL